MIFNIILFSALTVSIQIPLFAKENRPHWIQLKTENGVTSYKREVKGSSLIEFRGTGVIDANVVVILAHLSDFRRLTEWMDDVREIKLIEKISENEFIYYACVKAPWPLHDRDYVARMGLLADDKNGWLFADDYTLTDKRVPPIRGRVRMPFTKIRWSFKPVSENKTWVEFTANGDPGGIIPAWVANLVSKDLPFDTITSLRKRVKAVPPDEAFLKANDKYRMWGLKKSIVNAVNAKR